MYNNHLILFVVYQKYDRKNDIVKEREASFYCMKGINTTVIKHTYSRSITEVSTINLILFYTFFLIAYDQIQLVII